MLLKISLFAIVATSVMAVTGVEQKQMLLSKLLPQDGFVVVPSDETYGDARDLFVAILDGAKSKIDLSMYQLKDQGMIDALIRASKRGVQVRIVTETSPYQHPYTNYKNSCGGVKQLEKIGVPIKGLAPRLLERNPAAQAHQKILIVDDACLVVMSGNWGTPSLTDARDFALIINKDKTPLVFQCVKNVFESDWYNKQVDCKNESLIIGPGNQREQFLELFSKAKKSIEVYQQSYNDEKIASFLEGAARKGIKVKLLMMPFPFGGKKDSNSPFQDRLIKAGGEVRLVETRYIHAKAVIVDGKMAYIGSCNFFPPSLEYNREVGVITKDPSVIKRLREVFRKDWTLGKPK
jgi:cardiolipin synthase A/B